MSEIESLVRARYALVQIVSAEESRVIAGLKSLAERLEGYMLATWTITKGFTLVHASTGATLKSGQMKPAEALLYLEKTEAEGIFVLQDFHPYLKDPVNVRALRDVVEAFRTGERRRTLVMLGPVQESPIEVEKSIAIVDWPLPTRAELRTLAESLGGQIEFAGDYEAIVDASLGLTEVEAENALSKSAVRTQTLDPREIQNEKKQIVKKSGLLEFMETDVDLQKVGGLQNVKAWLKTRRNAFSDKAREYGLPTPQGVIVVGIPGTGKSLLAKAVGRSWNYPLLRFDLGKVFAGIVGSSEENMRRALRTIEAVSPCVVFIDEMEKAFGGSSGASDGGTSSRVFGSFLTWMQEKTAQVFVVATANSVESLPPELLRKGRFDEIFFFDLPTEAERREIFRIHLERVKRKADRFDLSKLAKATAGYTGAEIEQIVNTALFEAFDANAEIDTASLSLAIPMVVPISRTAEDRITRLREWASDKARPASAPETTPVKGRRIN